jgi:predicted negative regulator of RcsB-dependent stress response
MPETAFAARLHPTLHCSGDVLLEASNSDDAKAAYLNAIAQHPDWAFVSLHQRRYWNNRSAND